MHITFTEKQLINYFIDGQEEACIEVFLTDGPDGLRKFLGIPEDRDDIFQSVYDYFLFEKNLLYVAIDRFQDFLTDVMTVYGPLHLRRMFQIEDRRYDALFSSVMLYIGVSREALFRHVSRNIPKLLEMFHVDGPETVRAELHLLGAQYDDLWVKVLDFLLDHFALQQVNERQKSHVKEFFRSFRNKFLREEF